MSERQRERVRDRERERLGERERERYIDIDIVRERDWFESSERQDRQKERKRE